MTNLSDNLAPDEKKLTSKKYLFDTEFDYSEKVEDVQSITPKQLALANTEVSKKSYEEGYNKGVKDTNDSIARMAGDQMFVVTDKLDDLIETENLILETFHVQVAQVCELILSKVMPSLLDQGASEEVKSLINKAYSNLPQDKKITIKVHESLVSLMDQHVKNTENDGFSKDQITFIAGGNFEKADCEISWDGAGIEHYSRSIIQEVRETLLRLAGEPLATDPPEDKSPEAEIKEETEEEKV